MIYENVLSLIGDTPIVELKNIEKKYELKGHLYAKLEYLNPGLSIKDRPSYYMIEDLFSKGKINKGTYLLEATSGNTGIGLAMICSIYQIPLIIVMSKSATKERFLQMKCLGAKLILVHGDTKKAKLVCDALRKRCKNIIYVNQFQNEMNARAHYETTAQEIAKEKTFDEILVGLGSGGTYRGLYDFFLSTRTKVISVEKANPIPGLGYDEDNIFLNGINDSTREKIEVDYKESYFFFQELAKLEGLFVGISSGSVCSAGVKKLKKEAKDILLIFPDSGTRYFSLIESENT